MRTSLMTGGLLALAALLPPAGHAQTGGLTPSPGILAPHRVHLETRAVLDPAQIARYAGLRGHAPDGGTPRHGH